MLKKLLIGAASIVALTASMASASETSGRVQMLYPVSDNSFRFITEKTAWHNGRQRRITYVIDKATVGATKYQMMFETAKLAMQNNYSLWINVNDNRDGAFSWVNGRTGHYLMYGSVPTAKCSNFSANK